MSMDIIPQAMMGDQYARWLAATEFRRHRIYDPSFALSTDPSVYERMMRIAWIKMAVDFRAKSAAGNGVRCVPASGSDADVRAALLCNGLLEHVRHMTPARARLALAFFYGSTFEEMRGEMKRIQLPGDTKPRRWFVVTQFKNVDKRRFGKFRNPTTGEAEWKMMHGRTSLWEKIEHPETLIKHVYEDREQYLGWGSGLADALFWVAYAYTSAMEYGLVGLKRWAKGIVKAKVGPDRKASKDRSNDDILDEYIEKLLAMYERGVLAHGATDEIELMESNGSGHEIVSQFTESLKTDGTRLILGSLRPTGGGGDMATGARAQAETEADMFNVLVRFDQKDLDETLSHDYIGYLMDVNRVIFREAGCAGANPPRLVTVQAKRENPVESADVAAKLLGAGVPLVAEDVYEKTGFRRPSLGDELIEPREVPQMPAFPFSARRE